MRQNVSHKDIMILFNSPLGMGPVGGDQGGVMMTLELPSIDRSPFLA